MPIFKLHLRRRAAIEPDEIGLEFRDLHAAYLAVSQTIPDVAREELTAGRDPMTCAFIVCDAQGRQLMDVPFSDVLSPTKWHRRPARRRANGGVRSAQTRDDLALSSFRRLFSSLNVGCVLMTPDLVVREMNAFGARHSHVDPEAIRGTSILDIFVDLKGEPKRNFTSFMRLAQEGAISEVLDLPYYVLDEMGQMANGWWNARTWPIYDDDDHVIGLVEWAEPFMRPTAGGNTLVRIAPGSTA